MGQDTASDIVAMLARLDERVAAVHELLIGQRAVKEWYTTAEVAAALGKAESSRCASGAASAAFGPGSGPAAGAGRGSGSSRMRNWLRIRNEGLLPGSAQ